MLGILFMILKIIGWILLGILGLFLFLIVLVLFVPVPYRVRAEYGEAFSYQIRIFGIRILPRKEKTKEKPKRRRRKKKADETKAEKAAEEEAEKSPEEKPQNKPQHEPGRDRKKKTPGSDESSGGEARGKKMHDLSGRLKDLRGKWDALWAELTDEGNKRALLRVISELRYLLRHCGPRRVKADVTFSLGDPANTGFATAALSVCQFAYGKHCSIIPDFEAEAFYFRGWADIKGHVRMIHFLCGGLRLLLDKDIRKIIRKVRK